MDKKYKLLLADDDADDCIFFKEALEDLAVDATLATVSNGVELMKMLHSQSILLPDLLFLDLNMPLKNGFECLEEIKGDKKLRSLPVVIYSTSLNMEVMNLLYEKGAQYYIRKPGEFLKLKKVIREVLKITLHDHHTQPPIDKFILHS